MFPISILDQTHESNYDYESDYHLCQRIQEWTK